MDVRPADNLAVGLPALFESMAGAVEHAWAATNRSPDDLPLIAAEVLDRHRTELTRLSFADIAEEALATRGPQLNADSPFGNPPITWLMADHFCIESYLWLENSTGIHDHGFNGAWMNLVGHSIHRQFQFDGAETLSPSLRVGSLNPVNWEVLEPGDIRQIPRGSEFIHDLFHLHRPTVTLIIRSFSKHSRDAPRLQQSYTGFGDCSFARDSFGRPDWEVLQKRLMYSLDAVTPDLAFDLFSRRLGEDSLETALMMLKFIILHLKPEPRAAYLRAFKAAYGPVAGRLVEALLLYRQNYTLLLFRRLAEDPEDMLLFGLLREPTDLTTVLERISTTTKASNPEIWLFERLRSISDRAQGQDTEWAIRLDEAALVALRNQLTGRSEPSGDYSAEDLALQSFFLSHQSPLQVLWK